MKIKKTNKKYKLSTAMVYGQIPVWRTLLRVGLPSFFISMVACFFIFINYYLMVEFMPLTPKYNWNNLFINNHTIFNNLINNINPGSEIKNYFMKNNSIKNEIYFDNYEDFIKYIAIANNLNFYDTASTIRIAVSLTTPLLFLIGFVPVLLGPGSNVVFSDAIGIRNRLKEIKVWQNEFYVSLYITIGGMILIVILNYTITPLMINDAINENVDASKINDTLNGYFYVFKGDQIIFLKHTINNEYLNALTNLPVNINESSKIFSFTIQNNSHNMLIAKTFSIYYQTVGKYGIKWAENFTIISGCFLWIVNIAYTYINLIIDYGRTGITTTIMVVITIFNILLDWIFIYYCQLGMSSSAITTNITWFIALIPLIWYAQYLYKKSIVLVSWIHLLPRNIMWNIDIIKEMFYICLSSIIKYLCYMIVQVLIINQFAHITGHLFPTLGSLYFVSLMGCVLPIMNFFENTVSNFMSTGTTLVAFNYGIKSFNRINKIIYESSLFVIFYGFLIIGLVGYCTPISDWFLNIFGINEQNNIPSHIQYQCARKFLIIAITILPIRGVGNNAYILFRTTKRYIASIWTAIFRSLLVVVIFLYIFSAIAWNNLIPIENQNEALINPMYNPNIWVLIWTQSSAMITGNFILFIWIIWFMYIGIHKEKISWQDYKIILYLKRKYLKNILQEKIR